MCNIDVQTEPLQTASLEPVPEYFVMSDNSDNESVPSHILDIQDDLAEVTLLSHGFMGGPDMAPDDPVASAPRDPGPTWGSFLAGAGTELAMKLLQRWRRIEE